MWFEILSEFFVNVSVAWFATIFIEPQFNPVQTIEEAILLTLRLLVGILSLFIAKFFRERARKL